MNSLVARRLRGIEVIGAATEILTRNRSVGRDVGFLDAAEVQWWWVDGGFDDPANQLVWFNQDDRPIAVFFQYDSGPAWEADIFWDAQLEQTVRREVWPVYEELLTALPNDKPAKIMIDGRDVATATTLNELGWHKSEESLVQTVLANNKAVLAATLPHGFQFTDELRRDSSRVHPMTTRKGERVDELLKECSLYRPDLDLHILAPDGTMAGYCLCWLDEKNSVGIFEPVRVEQEFQRRGLGTALMHEGVRKLQRAGANCIKVCYRFGNSAAEALYRKVGFEPVFEKQLYLRN
ncbi:GNAT family N-acetyltransferase [Stratiformator vulcanicus]|uniref:Ribosomal-protein-alanine N-acetyltransferase n=1 Tax=Stratiformator vulcanicus TaxID=2527980 RepID=A0A517R5V6_9PLAN|nr:GNAT family N-acetyltransferase [Stratiformator vulcanicus]QDT39284.1 ribosomal-protein-alanine N-acetyltransferase [Stratiformator vulcanicus]